MSVFSSLRAGLPTKIPSYDKSKFNGQGDRVAESQWHLINKPNEGKVRVVIFEGWCVGFRALGEKDVQIKWEQAKAQMRSTGYNGRLGHNRLEDLVFIDKALAQYDVLTE